MRWENRSMRKKKLWGLSRGATNATTFVMKTWNCGWNVNIFKSIRKYYTSVSFCISFVTVSAVQCNSIMQALRSCNTHSEYHSEDTRRDPKGEATAIWAWTVAKPHEAHSITWPFRSGKYNGLFIIIFHVWILQSSSGHSTSTSSSDRRLRSLDSCMGKCCSICLRYWGVEGLVFCLWMASKLHRKGYSSLRLLCENSGWKHSLNTSKQQENSFKVMKHNVYSRHLETGILALTNFVQWWTCSNHQMHKLCKYIKRDDHFLRKWELQRGKMTTLYLNSKRWIQHFTTWRMKTDNKALSGTSCWCLWWT